MGYESKIYIVRKSEYAYFYEEGKRWAEEIAMIDMCKCYELSGVLRSKPETDCYIYADDGNTKILEDRYGMPLTETPLREAVQIVKDVIENSIYGYWRYPVLLATLQAIYDQVGDDDLYAVLHYGY